MTEQSAKGHTDVGGASGMQNDPRPRTTKIALAYRRASALGIGAIRWFVIHNRETELRYDVALAPSQYLPPINIHQQHLSFD